MGSGDYIIGIKEYDGMGVYMAWPDKETEQVEWAIKTIWDVEVCRFLLRPLTLTFRGNSEAVTDGGHNRHALMGYQLVTEDLSFPCGRTDDRRRREWDKLLCNAHKWTKGVPNDCGCHKFDTS